MELGKLVATRGVVEYCEDNQIDLNSFIRRYNMNDWGNLDDEDKHANNMEMFALAGHVLGKYTLAPDRDIYIETSWNDEVRQTTVLFPEER